MNTWKKEPLWPFFHRQLSLHQQLAMQTVAEWLIKRGAAKGLIVETDFARKDRIAMGRARKTNPADIAHRCSRS